MKTTTENNPAASQVPAQETGSEMNAVEKITLGSEAEAIHFFKTVKERLLDVNEWGKIAELPMSTFKLTDEKGAEVQRKATDGDYFKIDIPGPGTKAGEGYDWVVIEAIKEEVHEGVEILSMRARPTTNPLNDDPNIAHFLEDTATSTFQVKRIGNVIYAEEHGRNEVPNTNTDRTIDNIRNTLVGWSAKLGFSYPQWKSLVKGLINTENKYSKP